MFATPTGLSLDDFGATSGWTESYFRRLIGDVNGDGFADIVGISTSGNYASYGTASGSFTPVVPLGFVAYPSTLYGNIALADVSGDGRADIVNFAFDGVTLALGQADGTFGINTTASTDFGVHYNGWDSQDEFPRLLEDVNGDGRADIVGFGYAGVWVSLAQNYETGPAFAPKSLGIADFGTDQGWYDDNIYHREVADVNGDGRVDIIGFGDDGVSVSLSNGDGTFAPMVFALADFGRDQGWSTQDLFPRIMGDVNGDGRADIVGFGIEGVYVALARADGTFAAPTLDIADFTARQGWTSQALFPRALADINHDGRIDIVGFGNDGVLVGLNTGSHFGI